MYVYMYVYDRLQRVFLPFFLLRAMAEDPLTPGPWEKRPEKREPGPRSKKPKKSRIDCYY